MKETYREFWNRITAEGNLDRVAKARRQVEKDFPGWSRRRQIAHVISKFPPPPAPESEPAPEPEPPSQDEVFDFSTLPPSTNHVIDLTWAYKHQGRNPAPQDAPSGTAWRLYLWGCDKPKELVSEYLKMKGQHKEAVRDQNKMLADDKRRQFTLINLLHEEYVKNKRRRLNRQRSHRRKNLHPGQQQDLQYPQSSGATQGHPRPPLEESPPPFVSEHDTGLMPVPPLAILEPTPDSDPSRSELTPAV